MCAYVLGVCDHIGVGNIIIIYGVIISYCVMNVQHPDAMPVSMQPDRTCHAERSYVKIYFLINIFMSERGVFCPISQIVYNSLTILSSDFKPGFLFM